MEGEPFVLFCPLVINQNVKIELLDFLLSAQILLFYGRMYMYSKSKTSISITNFNPDLMIKDLGRIELFISQIFSYLRHRNLLTIFKIRVLTLL